MHRKIICGLIVLLVGAHLLLAQQTEQRPLRLGLGFFGTAYQGDLTPDGEGFYRFVPGANVSLQFASPGRVTPQVKIGFGGFTAQNRDIPAVEGIQPNTFVDTRIFFADFRLKARFLRDKAIRPYISAGIGLLGYTPRDPNGNNLLDNITTRNSNETYGTITGSFPLSVGTEVVMTPLLMLGLEYTFRPTGSDYLDNIGELGPREGNDRLQHFNLSLFFTFDPSRIGNAGTLRGKGD